MVPKTFIHTFGDSHFYASIGDRTNWYKENFNEVQNRIINAKLKQEKFGDKYEYLEVIDWINKNAPSDGNMEHYDHVTAILEQLSRETREKPTLEIADKPFEELDVEDFRVVNYNPHPSIRRKMAV
jgi:thymidylate synthase